MSNQNQNRDNELPPTALNSAATLLTETFRFLKGAITQVIKDIDRGDFEKAGYGIGVIFLVILFVLELSIVASGNAVEMQPMLAIILLIMTALVAVLIYYSVISPRDDGPFSRGHRTRRNAINPIPMS